jgi:hypothetical protein
MYLFWKASSCLFNSVPVTPVNNASTGHVTSMDKRNFEVINNKYAGESKNREAWRNSELMRGWGNQKPLSININTSSWPKKQKIAWGWNKFTLIEVNYSYIKFPCSIFYRRFYFFSYRNVQFLFIFYLLQHVSHMCKHLLVVNIFHWVWVDVLQNGSSC